MRRFARQLKRWAARIKRDGATLWRTGLHPATPWYGMALGGIVVGYALSPLDLIPDFIPVLGYVDDVLLLPALIWLAVKMISESALVECRKRADDWLQEANMKPTSRIKALVIVAPWIALGTATCYWWA